MFLGRIISGSKLIEVPFFIEITQKYEDDGVPTLIIGKKRAIDIFGKENIHVLDRNVKENVWWTYAKNERRAEYEEDLKKFIDFVSKKAISSVDYYFLNIFTERYSFFKKFLQWMDSDKPKSVFVTDRHVYIYGGKSVIGLSLADFEYAGIPSKKILRRIRQNEANIVFDEADYDSLDIKLKRIGGNIAMPYIHFLMNVG